MSRYPVALVPGGVSGRSVGLGVTMSKKTGQGAGAGGPPGLSRLSVYVAIISDVPDLVASVVVTDGGGFNEPINTAGDHVFADVAPGAYTATANDIDDGNGNALIVNVFQSPATLLAGEHACIFVVYCPRRADVGVNLFLQASADDDFSGSVIGGGIVLGIVNAANEVVARSDLNGIPISIFAPAGEYTAVLISDNSNGGFAITGLTTQTGVVGDTLSWSVIGNVI